MNLCPACLHDAAPSFEKGGVMYQLCPECKTLFVAGGLPNEGMVGGGKEIERNEQQNILRIERFASMIPRGGGVLDFGSGHGLLVKDLITSGMKAFGYDKYNLPFSELPKRKFDLVSMVEVIEHLSWPFMELDLIYHCLSDKGVLYIETSFVDLWEEPLQEVDYIEPNVGHCTIFSHKGLEILLERKGFAPVHHLNGNVRLYIKQIV